MALVSYSDSEASDEEPRTAPKPAPKPSPKPAASSAFTVDKSNPRKIRVNLDSTKEEPTVRSDRDGEPAAKRVRTGMGAFSGFNSMLPAPKRDAREVTNGDIRKNSGRKVFSLKTGAEPGFSRESDAELRHFFAEQDQTRNDEIETRPPANTPPTATVSVPAAESQSQANPLKFKPLSVSRNVKKKKLVPHSMQDQLTKNLNPAVNNSRSAKDISAPSVPTPKVSLFSTGAAEVHLPEETIEDVDEEVWVEASDADPIPAIESVMAPSTHQNSLNTIASDLNLSAADRRQLFGRNGMSSDHIGAINIVNFNTDQEYAANEVLRASGEQVQHNPVRAIAAGKHSLKQLVNAASTQKEALEESFATGRRNKKEAGSKYGW